MSFQIEIKRKLAADRMEEEHISKEALVSHLNRIIAAVESNEYRPHILQDIFDSTEEFLPDAPKRTIDPDMIRYVTFGWLITETIKQSNIVIDACPYCLRALE